MCSRSSFVLLTWLLFGFKFCLTHCGAGALLPHFGFVRGGACLPPCRGLLAAMLWIHVPQLDAYVAVLVIVSRLSVEPGMLLVDVTCCQLAGCR